MFTTIRGALAALLALIVTIVCSCDGEQTTLVIDLVPNPEINTRANISEHLNKLDIILDAQGGFNEFDIEENQSWGPYLVQDTDSDGFMELILTRRGAIAFQPFALTQGHQSDRIIDITAEGIGIEGQLVATGHSTIAFQHNKQHQVEVPFNLIPEYRPLRVLSMIPARGSRVASYVESITIQLSGEVRETAFEGQIEVHETQSDQIVNPNLTVSYIDSSTEGRQTRVKLDGCTFRGGHYIILLSTNICTPTDQCLDQFLDIPEAQPYEGSFTVLGDHEGPECPIETTCITDHCIETIPFSHQDRFEQCGNSHCIRGISRCSEGTCVPE